MSKVSRRLAVAVAVVCVVVGVVSVASAAPQPGKSCKVAGRERVTSAGTLRCVASSGRSLRWVLVAAPVTTTTTSSTTTTVAASARAPQVSAISADDSRVRFTLSGMSPDTGNYAVQWVDKGRSFTTYRMLRFTERTIAISTAEFACGGSTYTFRVFVMRADWQLADGHQRQNVTPHTEPFDVTFTHACPVSASTTATTTTTTVPPTTFSVTYNGNTNSGGAVPADGNAYVSGATVTVAGNTGSLTKTGYTFGGWCTTQPAAGAACGGTSRAAASTFSITSNTTLYAVWTANTLTVTTDEQGGSAVANTSTTTGASMNSPGTPTRAGYTFAGWFTASSGGSAITFPYAHGQTANFTLFAQWTVNCANGGTCAVGDTGPGGGIVFYVASSNFTSTGSDCDTACRYLEAAPAPGGGDVARSWATNVNSNRTTAVPAPGATATGIGSGMANTNAIQAQTGNVAASSAAVYAYDYSNGGKTDWHLASKDELNELCKYAKNQAPGTTATLCAGTGVLRAGFSETDYWSSTETNSTSASGQAFYNVSGATQYLGTKDLDVSARPIRAFGLPPFSLTYNGNSPSSGSVPTDASTYAFNATVTVAGNSGTLTKTGYTFDGWCTTQPSAGAACGGTSRAAASTFSITSNTTLYAVWAANTLTVTTDEQGGSAVADASTTTGASMNSPGTPTRTGYVFNGWFTASSGGSAITFPYAHGQTANFTLYAQWTQQTCAAGGACALGDIGPGGGIVFYVQLTDFTSTGSDCGTGCRYLEAATVDQSAGVAWCSSTAATGVTSEDLGAGRSNTTTADLTCTSGAIELAARYTNNGKSDWHLPSRTELTLMFNERARFSFTGTYWSSTELEGVAAWARDLAVGPQYGVNKVNVYKVRAIRAFGPGGIGLS